MFQIRQALSLVLRLTFSNDGGMKKWFCLSAVSPSDGFNMSGVFCLVFLMILTLLLLFGLKQAMRVG